MDLTDEMASFIDWLETNPLEPSAQTLWMHLMMLANKSGYPEWFAVTNPLLQAKVGISENSLTKHRNTLILKGRIEYKNQGKQKAGKYHIIPIASKNEVNREVKYAVKGEVNHAVKGSALLKDLKSSISLSSNPSSTPEGTYESFYKAHERVWGFAFNPLQAEKIGSYLDDGMEEPVIIRAIERAALKGSGYSVGLITRILEDYFRSGVKTLSAAEALDNQHDARRDEQNRRKEGGRFEKPKGRYEGIRPGGNQAESEFAFLDHQNRTGAGI